MDRELLLKNSGFWTSKIQIDLFNQMEEFMKENKFNRTQLAEKLGFTKGYITQVLNGDFDHRISKFVELALAIDKIPEITFRDINKVIQDERDGYTTVKWEVIKKIPNVREPSFSDPSEGVGNITFINQKSDIYESCDLANIS